VKVRILIGVLILLNFGCGEILHGPATTQIPISYTLNQYDLDKASDILAKDGHSDLTAIRGNMEMQKVNYVYYLDTNLHCTKKGDPGIHRVNIKSHHPQGVDEGGFGQIDSITYK
jgi:hypothetical protein